MKLARKRPLWPVTGYERHPVISIAAALDCLADSMQAKLCTAKDEREEACLTRDGNLCREAAERLRALAWVAKA
jgi:hypothetical protein